MANRSSDAGPVEPSRVLRLAVAAALVFVAPACNSRDSTETEAGPPSFGVAGPEPFVTLSGAGDQPFRRIVGVARLPDDHTVVAEVGRQLRWFDDDGVPVHPTGPGAHVVHEGEGLLWLRAYRRDSLIAYNAATGLLHVMDASGLVARSFYLDTDRLTEYTQPASAFPDGSVLVAAGPSHLQLRGNDWWAVLRLLTFTAEGQRREDLGSALRHPCEPPVERCAAEFTSYQGTWTAGLRGVYVARPDRTEIRMVDGDSVEILNGPADWQRTGQDGVPTYSRLILDSEGRLWAQSGDHSHAAVFDQQGRFKGVVKLPPGFRVHQVGPDYVAGVVEADGGTERVQLHRWHRTGG
jgi:hypothetical protein